MAAQEEKLEPFLAFPVWSTMPVIVVLQWLAFLVVMSGGIGFDHKGWLGLDLTGFIVICLFYLAITLFGLFAGLSGAVFEEKQTWTVAVLVSAVIHVFVVWNYG